MTTIAPLAGLRVLDLTRLLPGPFCTRILADLGADVVKVEDPYGGDYVRNTPPLVREVGQLFLLLNGNKRSIKLDLKNEAGREVLRRLLATYDVLIESYRPGVMARLGLGYEQLAAEFPRLIYASLSGYGQTGPYRDRAGHDGNYLSLAGVIGVTGGPDGRPVIPGVQVADLSGALYTALAVLAAAHGRSQTGKGCYVDLAMTDTSHALLAMALAEFLPTGEAPGPAEQIVSGRYVCYNLYQTKDGRWMSLCALEPKFFAAFAHAVGRADLAEEGFASARPGQRVYDELVALFASRTQAEWIAALASADCCCEPVLTLAEAVTHPQLAARGMMREVEHPTEGRVRELAQPFHFTPPLARSTRPAPTLGEAGLSAEKITTLADKGAFGPK
jgi:crotonobetainyl-CoA:carnitine CoA-transferase CaiB-like acyl-CoA transferase